ncbi:DUF4199 domain-containing protein [Pontibacter korlensis]|uniref:DUF4199 domain-containing protein n=1 Tax=Pontibacter korlensis TaxID=400092 RepID=A0A0E3UWQ8_9BACT|nr:DUF4199 domain-containing protein [Pontibacter korlensis]AKD03592.1 hypothetical protein PKOR_11200 [Pontibacter korlensis]
MFNQTIVRVSIRYGVFGGIVSFALVALLYLIGYNPFGEIGRISYLPIPVFIFLAIRYFKKFNEGELNFGKGFRVGLATSFYIALCAAMLVFVFIYLVGPEIMNQHVVEMKRLLEETREEQVKLLGQKVYDEGISALDNITPSMLAADDFVRRIFAGLVFSLVAAVYFRK